MNNWAKKVNIWHLTTNMVNSIQSNFGEKILIPSDFACMFKMSFFFWHTLYNVYAQNCARKSKYPENVVKIAQGKKYHNDISIQYPFSLFVHTYVCAQSLL